MAQTKITERQISFIDVTTGNATSSAHGFAPKLPNDSTKFLNGTGSYTTPSGAGGVTLGLVVAMSQFKQR